MRALTIHRPGSVPERRALPGTLRAGGSHADDLHLPGAPPAALRLVACPAGAIVEAAASGVRVGGRPVPPGGRRLLRPGERVEIRGAALALDPDDPLPDSTRAAASSLLRDAAEGQAPVAGTHLVVLTGPSAGTRHALRDAETIGRGRRATIRIADPHASRVHARLRLDPDGATVEDLSSKNGVRVNGVRIERPWRLRPGDEIAVGETALGIDEALAGEDGAAQPGAVLPRRRGLRPPAHVVAAALLALSAAALAVAAR